MTKRRGMVARTLLIGLGLNVLGLAWPAAAEAPKPMTMVDVLNVVRISDPQLSPDGQHLLFVKTETDWQANRRIGHLWRVDADGSDLRQLTRGARGESSPRWSPDGETIAFVARRGEGEDATAQIWGLATGGGEAWPLTDHETAVSQITWAPDGERLYFVADDPKPADLKAREKVRDDVYAFDENHQQRHLWTVDVETKAMARLTEGDFSVINYRLSRDGARVIHHRGPSPLIGDNEAQEIWVMAADGGAATPLTENRAIEMGAELSPDNRQVLFLAGANEAFDPLYNTNIFVLPAEGGAARLLTGDLPYQVQEATWSEDGRAIYFLANLGLRSELFRLDLSGGEPRQLTDGEHALTGWQYAPRLDQHVFIEDVPTNPGEVWTLSAHEAPQRVTELFTDLGETFDLPEQVRVEWKGADGTTVEGLLYYPLDYQEGTRYPLVVQTHGGPHASDQFGFGAWRDYIPVLASHGYAVLKPNYRGSTGYGDEFLRDMLGGYFQNAHLDVMAGVDAVVAMGVADPDRLAKMGWSAGGHMTNKLITFTDRFKAAASGAGASNWVSMYGQSDVRSYRTPWFGGTPWQPDAPIDVYWEHSPLKDVANVTTPTIFLVGKGDVRVPPEQSVEMHRALKANRVPTHLYLAPREPHGWTELRHALFKMNVELAWFEEHVTKRPYTWEEAPPEAAPDEDEETEERRPHVTSGA